MRRVGTLPCAGTPYEVVEGDTNEFPQLEEVFGLSEHRAQRILILKGMSTNRFTRTVDHEGMHSLINESGASACFRGETEEEKQEAQEEFISIVEPHLRRWMVALLKLGGKSG